MRKMLLPLLSLLLSTSVFADDAKLKNEALKLWEKRDDQTSLKDSVKKFEELHKNNPKDAEVMVYLTRGYFILGDSFAATKDEKLAQFEKAFGFGDKALGLNEEFSKRLKKNEDWKFIAQALTASEVPQMYWTAASIGKFARAKGIFTSMSYKSKIIALISRVEQLAPSYYHGAVDRYWGSYFAVIPSLAGKDLKKSREHFEKSLKHGPEYLGTRVLEAETYAVEKEDKKLFKKLLDEVLTITTYDQHPELGPENRLEKIKARKLLEKTDELF